MSIDQAIRVGEFLQQKKDSSVHGQFVPWIKKALPFNRQTAAKYMRIFNRREELKCTPGIHLKEAYLALALPPLKNDAEQIDRELREVLSVSLRNKVLLDHLDEIPDPHEQIRICGQIVTEMRAATARATEITIRCVESEPKAPLLEPRVAEQELKEWTSFWLEVLLVVIAVVVISILLFQ